MFGNAQKDDEDQDNTSPAEPQIFTPADAGLTDDADLPQAIDDTTNNSSTSASHDTPATEDKPSEDELLSIKQDALQALSPLVNQLDQTPEEKFKTTMMMIQASDDQSLVKAAYEAALKIKDEKARAQALLDVVNEINYFTQHHE